MTSHDTLIPRYSNLETRIHSAYSLPHAHFYPLLTCKVLQSGKKQFTIWSLTSSEPWEVVYRAADPHYTHPTAETGDQIQVSVFLLPAAKRIFLSLWISLHNITCLIEKRGHVTRCMWQRSWVSWRGQNFRNVKLVLWYWRTGLQRKGRGFGNWYRDGFG